MYTIYTNLSKTGDMWVFEGNFNSASEAAARARQLQELGRQVAIDSSEVPVVREDY